MRMPSDSSLKRMRIIAFSLLVVLIPFIVYYYFWVTRQTKYYTGRDIRVLATLTRHVEESVKGQSEVFKNAVEKYLRDAQNGATGGDTESNADARSTAFQRLLYDRERVKEEFQSRSLRPLQADGAKLTITNLDRVSQPPDESLLKRPRMEVRQEDNQKFLYFSYTTVCDQFVEGKAATPLYLNFKAKTNLEDLVEQFIDTPAADSSNSFEGDNFDALVLADFDDALTVVFEQSTSKLRLESLTNLTAASDGSKIDLKVQGQSTNMADVKVGGREYKLFFQPVELPLARVGSDNQKEARWLACGFVDSSRFTKQTWAVSYIVLIIFGFIAALVTLSWPFLKLLLIGPKDRLRPVDTYLLVVSAVMVTALLTIFAAFSVSYVSAKEQLDTDLEHFAGALKQNFHNELGNALDELDELNCDRRLYESATQIGDLKFLESSGRLDWPRVFAGSEFRLPNKCRNRSAGEATTATVSAQPTQTSEQTPSASPLSSESATPTLDRTLILGEEQQPKYYPYFISAFWADWHGMQQIKWTTRQNVTNNVSVADREYFLKLRPGGAHYTYKRGDTTHEFYLQPIVSKTTGQSEVVISKAIFPFEDSVEEKADTSPGAEEKKDSSENAVSTASKKNKRATSQSDDQDSIEQKPIDPISNTSDPSHSDFMWISAINTRLLSLMDPVVPSGFGFAVIDDTGSVLFHSAEKQHLGENFFEESDYSQRLRAAVVGRSAQLLDVTYLGKDHAVYVRPMDEFGWTVVAFRNKDYLRTTFSETLALCLALFLAYLLLVLILLLAVYLINRSSKDPVGWLWPAPDKNRIYTKLVLVNGLLILLSISAVWWLEGLSKIAVPLGSAFVGILYFVWILKRADASYLSTKLIDRLTQRNFLDHRSVYTLNATLLFVVISIVPAYACFKLSYGEEMKLFVKDAQLHLARNIAQRKTRLRAEYVATGAPSSTQQRIDEFLARRLKDTTKDVYCTYFLQSELKDALAGEERRLSDDNLIKLFMNFVPFFNESSVQRYALMSQADDRSWYWEQLLPNKLILHVQALTSTSNSDTQLIISTSPGIDKWHWWLIWPALLIIVALLLGYMFQQIFLFKRNEVAFNDLQGFSLGSVSQNTFLILNPPFIGRRELLHRLGLDNGSFERIDIEQKSDVEKWINQSNSPAAIDPAKPASPVVLDNFDYGSDNPTYNQQRLSLLEKLSELKRIAVAVSHIEPDRFMNGKMDPWAQNGVSAANTDRWAGVVSRFTRVSLEDFGDSDAFRTTLRNRKKEVLSNETLSAEAKEQIEVVFERIERECAPRACLQSIGEGIANQRDINEQTPECITRQVLVQALPYYKSIWRVCSDDEKLTMSHLAHDGLLSANDPDLDRLMKKGLIVRKPAVKLMNESFRSFVLSAEDSEALAKCEKDARKNSNWQALKVPLSIGVASVIVFLFMTQRELYNSALPIVTAITAGVPTFFSLISVLHGGGPGKPTG